MIESALRLHLDDSAFYSPTDMMPMNVFEWCLDQRRRWQLIVITNLTNMKELVNCGFDLFGTSLPANQTAPPNKPQTHTFLSLFFIHNRLALALAELTNSKSDRQVVFSLSRVRTPNPAFSMPPKKWGKSMKHRIKVNNTKQHFSRGRRGQHAAVLTATSSNSTQIEIRG